MARVEFAAAAENAVAAGRPAPTGDQVTAAATAIASRISSKQAAVPAPAAPAADPATLVAASAVAAAAASEVTPEARRVARRQRHLAEAAKMHEAAAERGLATAQYNLATCYMEGTGIEEDKAKAVQNYEKAAAQGHWMVSATGSNRVTTDLGFAGLSVSPGPASPLHARPRAAEQGTSVRGEPRQPGLATCSLWNGLANAQPPTRVC